jgi:hypothetical protein
MRQALIVDCPVTQVSDLKLPDSTCMSTIYPIKKQGQKNRLKLDGSKRKIVMLVTKKYVPKVTK